MDSLDKFAGSLVANWFDIVVIIAITWLARHFGNALITRLIKHTVKKSKSNDMSDDDVNKRQNTLSGLLNVVWKSFVLIVASMMIIQVLFKDIIDLSPLFASAGIVGVALGFGAQSLIKDFFSGIFIIAENQYRVGDVIDIEGAAGTVERVGIRSTMLRDTDGNVHYMPNGAVIHVINKTMGYSKVNFTLAVHPDTDVDSLASLVDKTAEKMSRESPWKDKILESPRFLSVGSFSELGMEFSVVGKTQPSAQWSVTGELRRRLLAAFQKNNIELAQTPTGMWTQKKK